MAQASQNASIQGLRGISVLLVVYYHAGAPIRGGFLGVDVFFVISGFVITAMLLRERDETGRTDLRAFFRRRIRRLLPALAALLIFVACGSILFQSALQSETALTGIAAALFSANAVLFARTGDYFDAASDSNPLLHTWTLAVEEQFYLTFPLLVIFCLGRGGHANRKLRQLLLVVSLLTATSLLACILLTYSSEFPFQSLAQNRSLAFYAMPTRAWEFGAGVLIAICRPQIARANDRLLRIFGLLGIFALALVVTSVSAETPFPGWVALLAVAPASMVIMAVLQPGGIANAVLSISLLRRVGDLSYSWYLWHWPILVFFNAMVPSAGLLQTIAVATLTIAPAWASYKFVEEPFRRSTALRGKQIVKATSLLMLVPLLAMTILLFVSTSRISGTAILRVSQAAHLDVTLGCTDNLPNTPQTAACTIQSREGRGTVLLVGDSNAGHFAEPVAQASERLGMDFILATKGACPQGNLVIEHLGTDDTEACERFKNAWNSWVSDTSPDLVILASASATYLNDPEFRLGQRGKPPSDRSGSKTLAYADGMSSQVDALTSGGSSVLLVNPVPRFSDYDLRTCPSIIAWFDESGCTQVQPRSEAATFVRAASDVEREVARSARRTSSISFFGDICGAATTCSTSFGNKYRYRDATHLSVPFSQTLRPKFIRSMRSALRLSE